MPDAPENPAKDAKSASGARSAVDERETRLAAALRANLRRRKAAAPKAKG
jgi:hypothetical protein